MRLERCNVYEEWQGGDIFGLQWLPRVVQRPHADSANNRARSCLSLRLCPYSLFYNSGGNFLGPEAKQVRTEYAHRYRCSCGCILWDTTPTNAPRATCHSTVP